MNQLVKKIKDRINGIAIEDMTKAESQIWKLVTQEVPNLKLPDDTLSFTAIHQPYCEEVPVTLQLTPTNDKSCLTLEVPTVALCAQQVYELGMLLVAIAAHAENVNKFDTKSVVELIDGYGLNSEVVNVI